MSTPDDATAFLRAVNPSHDAIQREMAAYADEHGFPIIGPQAGGLLRSIAGATGARRIFEFGSGFGYSAYWFLRGMPEDGEIVLTEFDADEIEMAEEFFERADLADRAHFEHGDAMDAVDRYEGPFDVVLVDHRKELYPAAFDAIREKLPRGAIVVADNIMRTPVMQYFGGDAERPTEASARGLVEYVEAVRADDDFHTVVLPVGNGLALSTRERTADAP
jgi:predicted O-methyltransferase YrrM